MHITSTTILLLVDILFCQSLDLKYRKKYEGGNRNFGFSIDAAYNKVVIGAPVSSDHSEPVVVVEGGNVTSISPPPCQHMEWFGYDVAINEKYVLVIGNRDYYVSEIFIYEADPPHR